ncbi:plasmodesmata-located protein 2 [Nicotiana tabacum]|uniref:Cysteine-rich repeat secretory protein 3 n=1 Tax=Nicotiana tabacum TaxID=4097 RepID=A0A1S3XXN0_TOBAC|nr:plasmodesmata-located protein 2-like isoform X1 [Nicotiana tomentosiformis]XP_016444629.1 PREDICTED: cysteine-rich repeat secretory protein 3-like [Nicotiana tabacum]
MGLHKKPCCILSLFLVILAILKLIPLAESASENTNLVYKGCAKQALSDPSGVYSQALSTLFGSLVSQSSKSKFYKTTTGSSQTTITGLFQCRGDLSNVECYNCVSGLPILIDKLCGTPVAARIQLLGCYMLYEVSGFPQISGMEMLYKTCSGKNAQGSGFEEKRDTAFSSLENGMASATNGFYTTSYESVFVVGQCEGDVGSSDCVECVKSAVQKTQVECGSSVSGQIFLHKCFVSFSYYPNGAPKKSSSSSYWSPSPSSGTGQNTGKTVAIILGGAAGVGFLVICLLFARNLTKKHDDY